MKYRLLFIFVGTFIVGGISYIHSGEASDTLLAMAVFAVVSAVLLQLAPAGSSARK